MKKAVFLLIVISFFIFGGCSAQNENSKAIETAQYYSIIKEDDPATVTYKIYSADKEVVFSETTDRLLSITMLDENTVDINKGMGTGLAFHKYYSVTENKFSREFSYVICAKNNIVAYINIPKENSLENRTVVVRNIFDGNKYFKEFELGFSPVDTPVVNAEFNDNMSDLNITYLQGETQEEISQTLALN